MRKRKHNFGRILKPLPRRSFTFRGVRFYTANLGASEPIDGRWAWFATGYWTHAAAEGVWRELSWAISDRFGISIEDAKAAIPADACGCEVCARRAA